MVGGKKPVKKTTARNVKKTPPKKETKPAAVQPRKRALPQRVAPSKNRRMQPSSSSDEDDQSEENDDASSRSSSSNSDRTSRTSRSRSPLEQRALLDHEEAGCSFNRSDRRVTHPSNSFNVLKEISNDMKEMKNLLSSLVASNQSLGHTNNIDGWLRDFIPPVDEQEAQNNRLCKNRDRNHDDSESWDNLEGYNSEIDELYQSSAPLNELDAVQEKMEEQEIPSEGGIESEATRDRPMSSLPNRDENAPTFALEKKKSLTSLSVTTSPPEAYIGHRKA